MSDVHINISLYEVVPGALTEEEQGSEPHVTVTHSSSERDELEEKLAIALDMLGQVEWATRIKANKHLSPEVKDKAVSDSIGCSFCATPGYVGKALMAGATQTTWEKDLLGHIHGHKPDCPLVALLYKEEL